MPDVTIDLQTIMTSLLSGAPAGKGVNGSACGEPGITGVSFSNHLTDCLGGIESPCTSGDSLTADDSGAANGLLQILNGVPAPNTIPIPTNALSLAGANAGTDQTILDLIETAELAGPSASGVVPLSGQSDRLLEDAAKAVAAINHQIAGPSGLANIPRTAIPQTSIINANGADKRTAPLLISRDRATPAEPSTKLSAHPTLSLVANAVDGNISPTPGTNGELSDDTISSASSIETKISPQDASTLITAGSADATMESPASSQTTVSPPSPSTAYAALASVSEKNVAPQAVQHGSEKVAALGQIVPPDEQVTLKIVHAAKDEIDHIHIRLEPESLGRVEVRLEIGHDGRIQAAVAADRQETFDLLQRDAGKMERALQQAGLKTDSTSLSFDLRQFNQPDRQQHQQGFGFSNLQHAPTHLAQDDVDMPNSSLSPTASHFDRTSLLNIVV